MNPHELSDEELIKLAEESTSKKDFCVKLGFKSTTAMCKPGPLISKVKRLGIIIQRKPKYKYTDEQILNAAKDARSITEIMRKISMCPTGYGHYRFKQRLIKLGIDVKAMPGARWNTGLKLGVRDIKDYLLKDGPYIATSKLRLRLIKFGLLENRCYECSLGPVWNNKPIVLQLEHVNGNRRDNQLSNLKILCPNCHSQTATHSKVKNYKYHNSY
jgi:hypothetical protein